MLIAGSQPIATSQLPHISSSKPPPPETESSGSPSLMPDTVAQGSSPPFEHAPFGQGIGGFAATIDPPPNPPDAEGNAYLESAHDRQLLAIAASSVRSANPMSGEQPSDVSTVNLYLAGKLSGQDVTTPANRLHNVISALGPGGFAAYVQTLDSAQFKELGIGSSFDDLVKSGALPPSEATSLAAGQISNGVPDAPTFGRSVLARMVGELGNDPRGVAFKNAFVHGDIAAVQTLSTKIAHGAFNGSLAEAPADARREQDQLLAESRAILDSTPGDSAGKRAAFEQLYGQFRTLDHSGDHASRAFGDQIAANAIDILSHASPHVVASTLRDIGGVDGRGNIAHDSNLHELLAAAIAGQASYGASRVGADRYRPPDAVASLLDTLSRGGDHALTQGVLMTIALRFGAEPSQTQSIVGQDRLYGEGLQASINRALGSSFNAFITGSVRGKENGLLDPERALVLTILSGIQSGPPFENGQGKIFSDIITLHACEYADFAEGKGSPQQRAAMVKLFGHGESANDYALMTSGTLLQASLIGTNDELANLQGQASSKTGTDDIDRVLNTVQTYSNALGFTPLGKFASVAQDLEDFANWAHNPTAQARRIVDAVLSSSESSSGAAAGAGDENTVLGSFIDTIRALHLPPSYQLYLQSGTDFARDGSASYDAHKFFSKYHPSIEA